MKYKKGKKFKDVGEAVNWLNENNSIYIRGKFTHFGWALNFSIKHFINEINRGAVEQAIKIEGKDEI